MKLRNAALLSTLFLSHFSATASEWVKIDDMSQLKYQILDNRVWLRNVNAFDHSWLGCCYAYYVDLTTEDGKATWSAMLAKIAMSKSFIIGVEDKTVNGSKIFFSGEW